MKVQTKLLTISEVANIFGVSVGTIRNWEERGYLNSIRTFGGHRRYNKEEIVKLINGKETQ